MNRVDQKIIMNIAKEWDLDHICEEVNSDSEALKGIRINGILYLDSRETYFMLKQIYERNLGWK